MKWPPPRFTPQSWVDLLGWAVFVWVAVGVAVITVLMVTGHTAIMEGGHTMMEGVNFVAGVVCGVLGGTAVSLLLLVLEAHFEAVQARRRERQSRILPLVTIVERQMLGDGK